MGSINFLTTMMHVLIAGISCLIHFSHENLHYKTKFAVNKRLREGIFGMFC